MITKIIPTLKRHGLPQDKVDFLIAMGENLVQMKSSTDMQKLEGLTDASANAKSDPAHNFESNSLEFTQHIRNMACNHHRINLVFFVILRKDHSEVCSEELKKTLCSGDC